jgi:hypothetical protein
LVVLTAVVVVSAVAGLAAPRSVPAHASFGSFSVPSGWYDSNNQHRITMGFGCSSQSEWNDSRLKPCDNTAFSPREVHAGVDIGDFGGCGSTNMGVYAGMSGRVWLGNSGGDRTALGRHYPILETDLDHVLISVGHTKGFAPGITNGQRVVKNQLIAYVGGDPTRAGYSDGASSGCHIHFEVDTQWLLPNYQANGLSSVSPYPYLLGSLYYSLAASPPSTPGTAFNRWGRNFRLLPGYRGVASLERSIVLSSGYYSWSDAIASRTNFDIVRGGNADDTIWLTAGGPGQTYTWHVELDQPLTGNQYLYHHWMRLCQNFPPFGCAERHSDFYIDGGDQYYTWTADLGLLQ